LICDKDSYDGALLWARSDFGRLVAVAKARDYYPTWIAHQLDHDLTPHQAATLARMIAEAGPYLSALLGRRGAFARFASRSCKVGEARIEIFSLHRNHHASKAFRR